jgi:hypothetical protein
LYNVPPYYLRCSAASDENESKGKIAEKGKKLKTVMSDALLRNSIFYSNVVHEQKFSVRAQ